MSDLFDNARSKAAQGLKLKPLETISLEGPCIDNQKRLNAFNRAIDDADQDLQALTATISAQGARIAELEELLEHCSGYLNDSDPSCNLAEILDDYLSRVADKEAQS